MAPGDGKLRGSSSSQKKGSSRTSKKHCSIQTDMELRNSEYSKLFSQNLMVKNPGKMTQSSLRRTLQGKSRPERQEKRVAMARSLPQAPRFKGQTLLEQMAVSPAVALDYRMRYKEFLNFSRAQKFNLKTVKNFDKAFTEFLNYLFIEGRDLSEASKFFAAALDANPDFSGKQSLPRSRRSLQGWSKLDPGNTRPPMAWALVALLCLGMLRRGLFRQCLATLLMFTAYLRPGEALNLREEDLVASRTGLSHTAINLHPSERQEISKVGLTDETILLSAKWKQKGSPLSAGLCHHEASLGSAGKPGRNACRVSGAVSTTSLRSITRSTDESQASAGSEAKGEVGLGLLRSSLRKSCQSSSRISTTAYPDTGKGFGKHSTLGEGAPKVFMPATEKDKKTWVIEVYAGSCHLSKAAAQAGYRALAIDIQFGLSCDILDSHVRRFIIDFASQHEVKLVWFGMPCQSWSRARRDDGGPPPLRDDHQFLWGKPNLGRKDQSKIELGNKLLLYTLSLIHQLRALHVPWALENPWSSRCWLVPEISTLLEHNGVKLKQVDYCQFNTPWKKSTGVMFESCDLHSIFKTCNPVNGRCSATHKKHFILAGQDSAGQWLTHRAQPYPPQLCRSIIQAL